METQSLAVPGERSLAPTFPRFDAAGRRSAPPSRPFLGYIHAFRALAITFIVAGHAIDLFDWTERPGVERALRIVLGNGTTLFIFIAGFLFQHLLPKFEVKRYYRSKLKNVLLPYALISIPAIVYYTAFAQREKAWPGLYEQPIWAQIAIFLGTGTHVTPLWFIPMIAIFYAIAPLLRRLDRLPGFYLMIPAFLVVSCLVPRANFYVNFVHYFSVYVLGMCVSRHQDWVVDRLRRNRSVAASAAIVVLLAAAEYFLTRESLTYLNLLQKIAFSAFAVGVLARLTSSKVAPWVGVVAECSYGVFFVHSYVLAGFKGLTEFALGCLITGGPEVTFLGLAATLAASIGLVQIVRALLGSKSRVVIGC